MISVMTSIMSQFVDLEVAMRDFCTDCVDSNFELSLVSRNSAADFQESIYRGVYSNGFDAISTTRTDFTLEAEAGTL
jgi:hypothetical protein